MLPPFVEALRPHQWVKNLLVLVPLLFTKRAFELAAWGEALLAFGSFCFAASCFQRGKCGRELLISKAFF